MKFPTILDAMEIKIPEGMHGQSLFPLIRDERVAIRKYGCYNKFGEAINVADGRWTLFQWPSGERIMPLHWYSSQPPQFLIPKGVDEYDGVNRRFPIDYYQAQKLRRPL